MKHWFSSLIGAVTQDFAIIFLASITGHKFRWVIICLLFPWHLSEFGVNIARAQILLIHKGGTSQEKVMVISFKLSHHVLDWPHWRYEYGKQVSGTMQPSSLPMEKSFGVVLRNPSIWEFVKSLKWENWDSQAKMRVGFLKISGWLKD